MFCSGHIRKSSGFKFFLNGRCRAAVRAVQGKVRVDRIVCRRERSASVWLPALHTCFLLPLFPSIIFSKTVSSLSAFFQTSSVLPFNGQWSLSGSSLSIRKQPHVFIIYFSLFFQEQMILLLSSQLFPVQLFDQSSVSPSSAACRPAPCPVRLAAVWGL